MTSKQIAMVYYGMCDSYSGEDKKVLDDAFNKAFLDAQEREINYAFTHSGDGYTYCAQ